MHTGKTSEFDSKRLAGFDLLDALVLKKEEAVGGGTRARLELHFKSSSNVERGTLTIVCEDVTEVKFGDLNATVRCLITVRDISNWGLERARYRILDDEARSFELNCADFTFAVTTEEVPLVS